MKDLVVWKVDEIRVFSEDGSASLFVDRVVLIESEGVAVLVMIIVFVDDSPCLVTVE